MTLGHEYHSQDNSSALYVAPYTDNGSALQLTGVSLTNANSLHVAITDSSGNQITSFGASTADQSTFTPASTAGGISMGVYETTPETLTNDQAAAIGVDVNRNVKVTEATLLAGENLTTNRLNNEPIYSYTNVAAGQATTTIKSTAGTLHAIVFNSAAASTGTMVMYDNTAASGTKIGTITATGLVPPTTVIYDISFTTGLTIITGTANSADMTFIYR